MYISEFSKPAYLLDTIDHIACELGVPTLNEQLAADRAVAASAGSGILTAAASASTISHVIANIATAASVPMDELSDDTFCYVIANNNPIDFEDPEKFAFRFGAGYIVVTRSTCAFDARHDCIDAQTTPLDLIVLACAMKMSQRDCYVLLRYNDIAMMANPAFASGNYTDASTGRLAGDAWKLFDGMLREMRSVVVSLVTHEIVSLPFYKFRNLGECEAYSLDNVAAAIETAERVEVTDKMDGSFLQMKWMGEECTVFGSSHRLTSMSGSLNPETNETLAFVYDWIDEFEAAGMRYTDMCRDFEDWTFIFEFVRPDLDSHIVQYPEERWGIYLLSARNVKTGVTMFYDELTSLAASYNLPVTECFADYDLDAVLDVCHTGKVSEREGFVMNIDGWYVKVKLDEFCAISKLVHGSDNFNVIIANVARGTFDDLLGMIPLAYHDPLVETARDLVAFNVDMGDYIMRMVSLAPADDVKAAVAFFEDRVPKPFVSLCIDAYRSGKTACYLYRNPRHPEPSCWKEHEFIPRRDLLARARAAEHL